MRTAAANGARTIRATWFRRIRIARHLTQAQLAKAVGISTNQISRYERGLDDPSLDILDLLLVALRCWYPDLLANPDLPDPPERMMHRPTADLVTGSIQVVIREFAHPSRPPTQYPDMMRCWNCHGRPGECRCYLICKTCGLPFHRKNKCSGVLHRRPSPAAPHEIAC